MAEAEVSQSSVPGFGEFSPEPIAWQDTFLDDVLTQYDYNQGFHEALLSGAYGSAKTMAAAHLAVRICLTYPNALGLITRRTLGDLRDTLYRKIRDHLRNDKQLVEGVDYTCVDSSCIIRFWNGSELIARSWHDGDYESVRSLDLTFAIFEEATELGEDDSRWYEAVVARLGRTAHIPFALSLLLCNPADPEHWLYKRFGLDIDEDPEYRSQADLTIRPENRHVYYSLTKDNTFLPHWYYDSLLESLDPDEAERLLHGRWKAVKRTVIYHQYVKPLNFIDRDYIIDDLHPVHISADFNIGEGKPMSFIALQHDPDTRTFHVFDEFINTSFSTQDTCDTIAESGILDIEGRRFIIQGDASGRHSDTRNNKSDWEIVEKFFSNYVTPKGNRLNFKIDVPRSNPRVRHRHNRVNAYLCNALGERRLFVYKGAPTVDEGLRLTKLKNRGTFIEDDSKKYQHCTTALGYSVVATEDEHERTTKKRTAVVYM